MLNTVIDAETPFRDVDISTEYHDDLGLVLDYEADWITQKLGVNDLITLQRTLSNAPASGRVTYELGAAPFKPLVKERISE